MNNRPSPTPILTPASEFKRSRKGQIVTLEATGRVVELGSVQLVRALASGKVPNELMPITAALVWGARDASDKGKEITVKELALEYSDLMDWVCAQSLIYPRITATGDEDDSIQIIDLDPREIQEIYLLATEPARMLYPFRGKQSAHVAVGADSEGGIQSP